MRTQAALRVVLGIVAAVVSTSCGFEEGVCAMETDCATSQRNTCESMGGTWHAYTSDDEFMRLQITCSSLGYTRATTRNSFARP